MKLTIPKSDLLKAIQVVVNVVGPRTTLPVLNNMLLKAEKNTVSFTTTNMDLTISCKLETKVEKTGVTTIPAKRMFGIVRELPEQDVDLVVDDKHRCLITCGNSFFALNGQSDEEFPIPTGGAKGVVFRMDQKLLKEMLGRTSYAASSDEARPILNGVLMSFKGSKLTVVATDGRRLALAEHELEFPKEAERDVPVPSRAVDELLRVLQDEGEVRITVHEKQVMFEFSEMTLWSKLLEGTYPNYRQVIPGACENRAVLEREAFYAALRRVALVSGDGGIEEPLSTKLTFTKNKLVISSSKVDVGEARETLAVKYGGRDMTTAFNPRFLIDPLKVLTSDEVYLELTDETSPAVLKADVPFLYVIMPIRVG